MHVPSDKRKSLMMFKWLCSHLIRTLNMHDITTESSVHSEEHYNFIATGIATLTERKVFTIQRYEMASLAL